MKGHLEQSSFRWATSFFDASDENVLEDQVGPAEEAVHGMDYREDPWPRERKEVKNTFQAK